MVYWIWARFILSMKTNENKLISYINNDSKCALKGSLKGDL